MCEFNFVLSEQLSRNDSLYGGRFPFRLHTKNSDRWFRVDLRSGWIKRTEVLLTVARSE